MYPHYPEIKVSITTKDGELLDQFTVCHWRTVTDDEGSDAENIGSIASEHLLVERIRRYVRLPSE